VVVVVVEVAKLYENHVEYGRELYALRLLSENLAAAPLLVAHDDDMLCVVVTPLAQSTLAHTPFDLRVFNAAR